MSHTFFIQLDDDKKLQWENLSEEQAKTLFALTQHHLSERVPTFGSQKDPNPMRYYISTVLKQFSGATSTFSYLFATRESSDEVATQLNKEIDLTGDSVTNERHKEIPKEAFDLMSKYLPVYTLRASL